MASCGWAVRSGLVEDSSVGACVSVTCVTVSRSVTPPHSSGKMIPVKMLQWVPVPFCYARCLKSYYSQNHVQLLCPASLRGSSAEWPGQSGMRWIYYSGTQRYLGPILVKDICSYCFNTGLFLPQSPQIMVDSRWPGAVVRWASRGRLIADTECCQGCKTTDPRDPDTNK